MTEKAPGSILITPDGDVREIDFPESTRGQMDLMYDLLNTREFDCVQVSSAINMWIDGEFLYNEAADPNAFATLFLKQFGSVTQVICGPVLLTGGADEAGNTLPLTPDATKAVLTRLEDDVQRLLREKPDA